MAAKHKYLAKFNKSWMQGCRPKQQRSAWPTGSGAAATLIGNPAAQGHSPEEIMDHHQNFVTAAIVVVYFLPFIVANMRGHCQSLAIFMLNLLAGWTVLGWVVAIVWACTDNVRSRPQPAQGPR
jgi:hypothetical protein